MDNDTVMSPRITAERDYRVRVDFEGAVALQATPAEFAALISAQGKKWWKGT